jgi:hypothetical protein
METNSIAQGRQAEAASPMPSLAGAGPCVQLLSEADTAASLGVKVQTLRVWSVHRKGPPRVKVGRRVFYRPEAVQGWLTRQERDPAAFALKEKRAA